MEWWLLVGAVVLVGLLAWRVIRAYNTLSLHHSLCLAAWHQLDRTLAMRHTLVGALLLACQPGADVTNARAALVAAERLARQRGSAGERHPVEMDLFTATRELDAVDEDQRTVGEQLATINGWVASSARYYNQNVDRYLRRRSSPSALLIRFAFPAMSRFSWPSEKPANDASAASDQATAEDLPLREADNPEGYRPVSFTNILRRRAAEQREIRGDDSLEA